MLLTRAPNARIERPVGPSKVQVKTERNLDYSEAPGCMNRQPQTQGHRRVRQALPPLLRQILPDIPCARLPVLPDIPDTLLSRSFHPPITI